MPSTSTARARGSGLAEGHQGRKARARRPPADTDGRSFPGHACQSAGGPHCDLASGRRGRISESPPRRTSVSPATPDSNGDSNSSQSQASAIVSTQGRSYVVKQPGKCPAGRPHNSPDRVGGLRSREHSLPPESPGATAPYHAGNREGRGGLSAVNSPSGRVPCHVRFWERDGSGLTCAGTAKSGDRSPN
jgi:hypothetical protein